RVASPPPAPSISSMSSTASDRAMDTPQRNLPRPIPTTLPPGEHGLPVLTPMAPLTPMPQLPAPPPPPPPTQWQNADESMRQWLQTKAEEDRRRQEEERTRQESLRLEKLKIEQTILRDSLQAGLPPYMAPLLFASIRQAND